MPHLYLGLSSHGFGHAAQMSAVVGALRARCPDLRITVDTALPAGPLAAFLPGAARVERAVDVGLVMAGPVDVRPDATAAAYEAFHRDWDARVAAEAARLARLAPDLVVANAPALPLAAAARAGLPALALCSLNWADLLWRYCGDRPAMAAVHRELVAAYRSAAAVLVPEPGMAMPDLPNRRAIGPVARLGRDRRRELRARLGVPEEVPIVLASLGGIASGIDYCAWPRFPHHHLVVQADGPIDRPDMTAIRDAGMPVIDLIASVDVAAVKPGYGFFVEAACNGIAVLHSTRPDWPEEPGLSAWLHCHTRALAVDREAFEAGRFAARLDELLALPAPARPTPNGNHEAAEILQRYLNGYVPA